MKEGIALYVHMNKLAQAMPMLKVIRKVEDLDSRLCSCPSTQYS